MQLIFSISRATLGALVVLVGVAGGGYWLSVAFSLQGLEAGIRERDVIKLQKYINWVVIRDQLRSEIRGTALRRFYVDATRGQEKPGMALGSFLAAIIAPAMVDQFIDSFVTPQGFVDLLGKHSDDRGPDDLTISRIGFTDFDEYSIELGKADAAATKVVRAALRREGIVWE